MNTVYVVDVYNPCINPETIRKIVRVNESKFCIREVELEWGKPKLNYFEDDYLFFRLYDTYEEAEEYLRYIKSLEGSSNV